MNDGSVSSHVQETIPGFYNHPGVHPECAPFARMTGKKRVMVFVHGFTGSPADFAEYVELYEASGFDVVVPLLPGHGSHISYLERLGIREIFIPFKPMFHFLFQRYEEVHVIGLSYGAVLTASLALDLPPKTLSFFAPAFFLTEVNERKSSWIRRLGLQRFIRRIDKTRMRRDGTFRPISFTYDQLPLAIAMEFHEQSSRTRPRMSGLKLPIFHAHDDRDDTTCADANHVFLRETVHNYTYFRTNDEVHVITIGPSRERVARAHLDWLEGLSFD